MRIIQRNVDYKRLKVTGGNKVTYDFIDYETFKELFRDIYYRNISIDEVLRRQDEFNAVLGVLIEYFPRG